MLNNDQDIERCLIWILALVRGKQNLTKSVMHRTLRDLTESLQTVSKEPSRRGLLASLLANQIEKSM